MGNLVSFRNAFGIYQVLQERLQKANNPLTCTDLFDYADVKQYVDDANRVSDYLGHMYRKGLLKRFPAPKTDTSSARYAYLWKDPKAGAPRQRNVAPRLRLASNGGNAEPEQTLVNKPNIQVTEQDGVVTVELPTMTLTIKTK